MAEEGSQPTHWAVLVGVGLAFARSGLNQGCQDTVQDISLKGAVQDAIAINSYLKGGMPAVDITMHTATRSSDDVSVGAIEAPELLPTIDNLFSSFMRILESAKPGNSVYIHYSGHGTRRDLDGAVAFTLIHPGNFEARYLYGTVLRNAIARMLERGLIVTLVLDCCFSGGVLRTDQTQESIRYLKYDPAVDAKSKYNDPFINNSEDRLRGADINLSTLLDPNGYTIITACGPQELALELQLDGGTRMGALSYFLVDSLTTLRKRGVYISHQTLHQHIRACFHARHPQQTPMLYGKRRFSFFGDFPADSNLPIVSMHRNADDCYLILNSGQAHGVHELDEYALYPFDTPEDPEIMTSQIAIKAKVERVDCLTSKLATVELQDIERIRKGSAWKATLLTSFSPRKICIHLLPGVPERDKLVEATKAHLFLILSRELDAKETHSPVFQVHFNAEQRYEVQDPTSKQVFNLPSLPYNSDGNHAALLDMLGHLAKFKYFEGIENRMPSLSFESSFNLSCDHDPGGDGFYRVKDGQSITLKFENLTGGPKYLAIFVFTQAWEIRNLVSEAGEDACLQITSKGSVETGPFELPLTMSVSRDLQTRGQCQTEDIVKLFITSRSSVFPGMILPQFGAASLRGGPDHLARFIQGLNTGITGTRNSEKCEWTTRNYLIRTSI
jgi:hypothetical protein